MKLSAPKPSAPSSAKKAAKPKKVVGKPEPQEEDEEKAEAPLTDAERLQKRDKAGKSRHFQVTIISSDEKAVLYLRHRLQKGFLTRDTPPKEEEMTTMAEFFDQLEGHRDLEPSIIRNTKIHKVLKQIVKLPSIPKDEEYEFKKRSSSLLTAWSVALNESGDAPTSAVEASATNGEAETEQAAEPSKTDDADTKDSITEPPAAPVETIEPGNSAVDEADTTMADASTAEVKDDKPTEHEAEMTAPDTTTTEAETAAS